MNEILVLVDELVKGEAVMLRLVVQTNLHVLDDV